MNGWLKAHKILLGCFLLAFALQLAFMYFIVSPIREEFSEIQSNVQLIEGRLRGSQWPMEPDRLKAYIAELQLEKDGSGGKAALARNSRDALNRCQVTFMKKITAEHGDLEGFMRNASRIDYQSDYNRILADYAKRGVRLEPQVLNLSEEMATQYIYQSVMQLWTVDKLLGMALDNGLELGKADGAPGVKAASMVSVRPMKAYFLNVGDERPYLLEFPVEIGVSGSLASCLNFVEGLNAGEVFLPPVSFEVFSMPPDGGHDAGFIRMRLVCSSFLVLGKIQ